MDDNAAGRSEKAYSSFERRLEEEEDDEESE